MQQADEHFLKLFHNNLVGMVLSDEKHLIVDINNTLLEATELNRDDVVGKTALSLNLISEKVIKDNWVEFDTYKILKNKELSFTTKSGEPVSFIFSSEQIVFNEKPYQLSTFIDISQRKKSENELIDVYERVTDGFVAIDKNWNYTYINKTAGVMMDKNPAAVIGKQLWEVFPHLVGSDIHEAYEKAMHTQKMITLEQYFAPNDTWYMHMIYPSPDGLSIFFKDISYRKKQEESIAESELLFRTLTKTAPVGIFETDANGSTTFVNETWLQYSGMHYEEAMGDGWLNAVHPDDREWLQKGWHSKTEVHAESVSEYRIVHKNGKLRWVNGKAVPVFNNDAVVKGYIGIVLDVTERKEAEISLEENSKQLRELSRHLQQVREEERTKIAREIHDELGQQLTGLKMDIAWLMKKTGMDNPDIKKKFADTLLLVDNTVRSIRRIATELRPSVIDDLGLNASLEWQVTELRRRMNIEIEYVNSFDDTNINPDISIGIFRILQESLTNIAKHAAAKKLKISITELDGTVTLTVEDDGIGFETAAKKDQLTFGLIGIKERTSMLQGECTIFSEPGRGTKIVVRIPLKNN